MAEWIRYHITESGRDLLDKMTSDGVQNEYFKNTRFDILQSLDYCPLGFKSLSHYHVYNVDKDVLMHTLEDLEKGGYISTTVEHGKLDYDTKYW